MDNVFVVLTTDLIKIDYVVLAQLTFLVFAKCTCNLTIPYPMYLLQVCDLSSTIRIAN